MTTPVHTTSRDVRRMQTRQRILGAAIAEFTRSGMADADVDGIAAAAGVAHGTFYFHFPTKAHVLLELERREETRMAAELTRFLDRPHDLTAALTEVVRQVQGLRQRLGSRLFKELLALHFSPSRPESDDWTDHPVIVTLVGEIEQARARATAHPDVDAFFSAMFFLLGIYGVLSAADEHAGGEAVIAQLVGTAAVLANGLETH